MDTIRTRHGHVALDRRGSGPPIVLLHSGGHDRHDFDAIVPQLAARFETLAFDLPAHGDSSMFTEPARARAIDMCEGILDAVDALDVAPAIVVGNSVGGTAALHLAMQRPERVKALVLVSTSGFVEASVGVRAYCRIQGIEAVRRHLGMAFARFYLKKRNVHTTELLARMQRARTRKDFIAMEAALWRSFSAPESNLSADAERVRCPVHFVWGRHDPVLRANVEGRRARALLPHATWTTLDLGHVPFVEDPAAFLEAVRPFFDEVARSTARAVHAPAA
jgi:pimeloyl-ACP methyl ester carboxylesterase